MYKLDFTLLKLVVIGEAFTCIDIFSMHGRLSPHTFKQSFKSFFLGIRWSIFKIRSVK